MIRRYPRQEYLASGKLISRLTHSLAKVKDWTLNETVEYVGECTHRSGAMVYRWQQGRSRPKPEIVAELARLGYQEADLSREWCEELLHETQYPNAYDLLDTLWGPRKLLTIPHRLPSMEHTRLIGRQEKIGRLQRLLSPRHSAHLIIVDGIGGVGKTALVLDVAYHALQASTGEIVKSSSPTFEAIIFVSAKQQYLTAQGILPRSGALRTLHKIFDEVTISLGRYDIKSRPAEEQPALVEEILGRQRTLLIVDNLETMENRQEIISFLYELPPAVKVVITTREKPMDYVPIRLEQLEEEDALELIAHQAEEKEVAISKEDCLMLYRRIGGIPAALVYAVGQRAAGYSLEWVLNNVARAEGDVARFCFKGSVEPLREKPAHAMLKAFALFPRMPLRATLTYVAGLEPDPMEADEALSQLQRLSLVREFDGRFRMLSLTREYAMAELRAQPKFEEEAHERWVAWYQGFARRYGGHDIEEWHVRYDHLDEEWENLLAVFDWCASDDRYEVLKTFWCAQGSGSVVDFAHLYGYWDDRLTWLNWLMSAAEARGDWLTVQDTVASIANTMALMNRFDEAEELFKRSQKFYSYASLEVKIRLLINHAYLYTFMMRLDEAAQLLDQASELVAELQEPLQTRTQINIDYDYAAILYWRGDLAAAEKGYLNAKERASASGWQTLANYAQNYLAEIALKQERYDEAEHLLEPGLAMAKRNKDRRRESRYMRTFANLCYKQGKLVDALTWARKAKDGFERLGIEKEAQEMEKLMQDVRAGMNGQSK